MISVHFVITKVSAKFKWFDEYLAISYFRTAITFGRWISQSSRGGIDLYLNHIYGRTGGFKDCDGSFETGRGKGVGLLYTIILHAIRLA